MTALPLTAEDMAAQLKALREAMPPTVPTRAVIAALEQLGLNQRTAYMRYGPAMRPADTSATINGPPMQPSQSPAVSGETVPSQVEPSAGKTGPGELAPSAPPAPTTTPKNDRNNLTDAQFREAGLTTLPDGKVVYKDTPEAKDAEIKAIEAVCPHLSLSDSLFKRLKEVGVIKYPGTMSDRINCLRGLSVEQLRYIRTGVRQ